MTDERPLHVRVAEALGWTGCLDRLGTRAKEGASWWEGYAPGIDSHALLVPRYDTDWSATGPLIERLRIAVTPAPTRWYAESFRNCRYGDTPLEAVCLLLLALHEADHLADLLAIGR